MWWLSDSFLKKEMTYIRIKDEFDRACRACLEKVDYIKRPHYKCSIYIIEEEKSKYFYPFSYNKIVIPEGTVCLNDFEDVAKWFG